MTITNAGNELGNRYLVLYGDHGVGEERTTMEKMGMAIEPVIARKPRLNGSMHI